MRAEHRRGFTLVELLVVIAIIGLLLGLMIPAIDGRPRVNFRLELCKNNAAQLAKATLSRAIGRKDLYPGYMNILRVPSEVLPDEFPVTPEHEIAVAWPAQLLPELDQQLLSDTLLSGQLDLDDPPRLDVLLCTADPLLNDDYPGLSYIMNSGMPDLDAVSETTPSDLKANGVCHDLRPDRFGPTVRISEIPDGTSRTILLSENSQRDYPKQHGSRGNTWLRPVPGAKNIEQWYGMTWVYDAQNSLVPARSLFDLPHRDTRPLEKQDEPFAAAGSRFARPASNHLEVFVVAFCDGSVRAIHEDIDYRVYQQLMTPDGAEATLADAPETDMDVFMDPPLNDGDY